MPYVLMKNKSKHLVAIFIWLTMFNFLIIFNDIISKIIFNAQVFKYNFYNFLLGLKNIHYIANFVMKIFNFADRQIFNSFSF